MPRTPTPPPAPKREFVTDVTRQARTVLASILGYAEMMEEELRDDRPDLLTDLKRIHSAGDELNALIGQLEARVDRERHLATVDVLTGLFNRRHLVETAPDVMHEARTNRQPLSLLIFDIDLFKQINDSFGHEAGDEVLQAVAGRGVRALREADTLIRFGGDEFVALLPNTHTEHARIVAERLRSSIADSEIATANGHRIKVSISVGVTTLWQGDDGLYELIHTADQAMYAAKQDGRDRVRVAVNGMASTADVGKMA